MITYNFMTFTFHYVSIKSGVAGYKRIDCIDLHSTMYLLNLTINESLAKNLGYLHSTMYLLNLCNQIYLCPLTSYIYIPLCIY